jgi:hypothetical protein
MGVGAAEGPGGGRCALHCRGGSPAARAQPPRPGPVLPPPWRPGLALPVIPPPTTLVPLNEEASYHGNNAGGAGKQQYEGAVHTAATATATS